MPPPVRPSDEHSSERGEWWRKDGKNRELGHADPDYEKHIDEAELNDEAFKESQLPIQNPT